MDHPALRAFAARRRLQATARLAAALMLAPAAAAPPPAEVFFGHPDVQAVHLSPGGDKLAVLRTAANGRDVLYTISLDDMSKAKAVAGFRDFDVGYFRWAHNDRLLYRVYDRQRGSTDQYYTGLNSVGADGSQERNYRGGGSVLAIPEDGSQEIIIGETLFNALGEASSVIPHRMNLGNGQTRLALAESPGSTLFWGFDRRGEARLAMTTQGRGKITWFTREAGEKTWTPLISGDPLHFDWTPHAIDGEGRLYLSRLSAAGTEALVRWNAQRKAPEAEDFVSTAGFDFEGELISDDESGRLLGVQYETDAAGIHWLDAGLRQLQAEVDARLPGRVNLLRCRRCTRADRVVLVHSYSPREPGQWFVVRGSPLQWIDIGRSRRAVDPRAMANVEFHRIKARDGRDLPVWLTLPAGRKPGTPGPTVVMVHGGPWMRGGRWEWEPMDQFLASRGYLVVNAEFRGSTGYGAEHFQAGWRQWGRAMQDDVADALKWTVERGLTDPKRVCIAGASFGGYTALMGTVRHPDLYRCAAAWVAVTDPRLMFEPLWRSDISERARRYELNQLIGDPSKDADLLAEVSPVAQAERIKTPLLLAFGQDDSRVPIDHARKIRSALAAAGQKPEFVVYDREGHYWQRTETRLDFAGRLERFLARHLGETP